jgi:hypothetical protein
MCAAGVTASRFGNPGWALAEELTDGAFEARLFPDAGTKRGHRRQIERDWANIHRKLKRIHVTLSILWDDDLLPRGRSETAFAPCLTVRDKTRALPDCR